MRPVRLLLVAAVVAGATVAALVSGGGGRIAPAAAAPGSADVRVLVDQLASRDSLAVVRALERRAAASPGDRSLDTLLGLGYQQLFRETGDPSWLTRSARALSRAPVSDPAALVARAQLANTRHRFRAAVPLARAALRGEPRNVSALGALGDALLGLGRYREAFTILDRAAFVGPSVGAYARISQARRLLGRSDAAIEAMELALEAGSGIPEQKAWAETQLGSLLLARGRVDEARAAFVRSLRLLRGYVPARVGLARVDVARGRNALAARRLAAVVARLPQPAYATQLAELLARAGRPVAARRAEGLVETISRLQAASGIRTELQTALFDLDRGVRVGDALLRARLAYREGPSVAAADAVAWGLARSGRCRQAQTWSRRALRLGTDDGLFLFHRGMIERCLGSDGASSWFRRALDADPWFSIRWEPVARRLAR